MSYTKRFFALLTSLVVVVLLSTLLPVNSAPTTHFPVQQVDTERIDAYIRSRMQIASIPGLALGIVQDDQIVYLKGYGIAGPDGRAVTPQTPFILGSTSKSFTALAIMQLVEMGKIDLDSPVNHYLPWFRLSYPAASAQITVRNLLNQNSGLPTSEGRQGLWDNNQSSLALENGVRALSSVQLSRPPGEGYEYANENYDILGLIVQTVSGLSYEEYVRSAIFTPLQMHHSAAALSDSEAIELATGYRYWFFWPFAFDAPYPRRSTPSGMLISSAEDMVHYLIAHLNDGRYGDNHLLSSQGVAMLHTPGSGNTYGMGWVIQGQPGSTRVWHNGDLSNFHSNMLLLPDQHIGIVTLINISEFYNNAAVNIPIEGVAEIVLGNDLTATTNPPFTVMPQGVMLVTMLIPILWIVGSYFAIRRWKDHQELPPRGITRIWRFYLPLVIDFCPLVLAWMILPSLVAAPMEAIALFVPDVFLVIVTVTVLSLGWAIARIVLTLPPPADETRQPLRFCNDKLRSLVRVLCRK